MPSTITAFNTFVAATKAKSSEVNTNFDNLRGNRLPINSDTASASDLTHNLGSDEHRWLGAYVGSIDFETSTSTASLVMQGQTGNTTGAFEMLIEGVTAAVFDPLTAGPQSPKFQVSTFTADGSWTCPSDTLHVILLGAGGGAGGCGGGGGGLSAGGGGGGGGAGCYPQRVSVPVTPGIVYSLSIGIGGAPGTAGATAATGAVGSTGGTSTFGTTATTLASFYGAYPGIGGAPSSTASVAGGSGGYIPSVMPVAGGNGAPNSTAGANGDKSIYASGGAGGGAAGAGGGGGGGGAGRGIGGAGGLGGNGGVGNIGGAAGISSGGAGGGGGAVNVPGGSGSTGGSGFIEVGWIRKD